MNLSETAFLHPDGDCFRLRWLTPTVEIDLCGHATLASAHVLWETKRLRPEHPARFATRSGMLTAVRDGEWIVMDFPALPVVACSAPAGLMAALGVESLRVGRTPVDYLVEVDSEAQVRDLRPDHRALSRLPVRGVIVTAPSDSRDYDFVSRFFEPGSGVAEDPVTGSTHCTLGPYWGERTGKSELVGYQASARGGSVRVTLHGERVHLAGRAVTIARGAILGPEGG
jgi:PhzF family phenazine biosynthesis protein